MNNNSNKILAFILSMIIMMFSLLFIFNKKIDFSENENRYLQEIPKFRLDKLIDGKYIQDIENYFTDHFPFRDWFVVIKTKSDKLLGLEEENSVYFCKNDYLIEKYNSNNDKDKFINKLNNFYDKLDKTDMSLMLVPSSISVNYKLLPKNVEYEDQVNDMNYIYDKIKFRTVNVYNILLDMNDNYQMYYRLDHHWTSYGAYYGYMEYMNSEAMPIDSFKVEMVTDKFMGTLYSKSGDYSRKPDKIYLFIPNKHDYTVNYVYENKVSNTLYEMSYIDKKDKYALFLDNNHPLIVITNNDINTDREIVVIKDSYANSFIPFLINNYKRIHVIDPRYFNDSVSEYINSNNINEGLILYNMNTVLQDHGIMSME